MLSNMRQIIKPVMQYCTARSRLLIDSGQEPQERSDKEDADDELRGNLLRWHWRPSHQGGRQHHSFRRPAEEVHRCSYYLSVDKLESSCSIRTLLDNKNSTQQYE